MTATKDSRDTIKWLATAIGAAAAVAFGAGPVLASTTLDIAQWQPARVFIYIVSAVAGAAGVAYIIWTLLKALVPRPMSLDDVPADVIAQLDATAEVSYPGDINTYEEFLLRFAAYRNAAIGFRYDAALSASTAERAELITCAEQAEDNLKTLRRAEDVILEKAGFSVTRQAIYDIKWPVLAGVCFTVLAVAVFQLTISGPAEEAEPTASPTQAVMVKIDTSESKTLWKALRLEACEMSDGRVPVLVDSGSGTTSDPYLVQTVTVLDGCPAMSFAVTSQAAIVVMPEVADQGEDG
ncbi:hypothetical protein [Microbacterium sulfonylureivorans]|uniref:hypothetical protein n=1 Tax=Microbacterium sulfonylureivorans TaxID=2486854 RepID=UPI000FD92A23|nr:hypothetical protein [Microbacterium sulfonylureivorans]